jgi:hypothetical protein
MEAMFEKASRLKLRIPTNLGSLNAEDLWDLPLTSRNSLDLDTVAKALHRSIKASEEESFITKTSKASETLQLRFDIVKYIIDVKMAEAEVEKTKSENKAKRQRILEIVAAKQNKELEDKPLAELLELANSL